MLPVKLGFTHPTHSAQQSQSTNTGLWWRKVQRLLQGPARRMGSSCSTDPNSPKVFRKAFKVNVKQGALRKWSAHAQFSDWLILRYQGGYLGNLNHQHSDSSWSGVYMLLVSMYMVGVSISAKLKNMIQDIIYSPWGKTEEPWFYFMAKHLLFFLLDHFPLLLHFLTSLNLLYGTQGRWKLSYK